MHHITIQTTLFLVAGLVERTRRRTSLDRLGGLARLSPLLALLFFVPALNLAGIPPFSGFLGKVGLAAGRRRRRRAAGLGPGRRWVLTSLLTLYAIARVWNLAFWRAPHADHAGRHRRRRPRRRQRAVQPDLTPSASARRCPRSMFGLHRRTGGPQRGGSPWWPDRCSTSALSRRRPAATGPRTYGRLSGR